MNYRLANAPPFGYRTKELPTINLRLAGRALSALLVLALALVISLPGGADADADAPENDAGFWLEIDVDGWGLALEPLPAYIAPTPDATGLTVIDGTVVEQTTEEHLNSEQCTYLDTPTCDTVSMVTGTYSDGHIEIILRHERTITFDGSPASRGSDTPVEPGTAVDFREFELTGDYDTQSEMFQGKAVITENDVEWSCAAWEDNDVGGICELDRYVSGPEETETTTWRGWIRGAATGEAGSAGSGSGGPHEEEAPAAATMEILNVTGDVEYIPAGSDKPVPPTSGVVLGEGDKITTGFESGARVRVGQSEFSMSPLTSLTIEEYLRADKIEKTILNMRVGALRPTVRHTDAIRSDFSVHTPTANSSVRGTEFVVSAGKDGPSTTYVLDGTVLVKNKKGKSKDVSAGNKVTVRQGGKIVGPDPYSPDELPTFLADGAGGSDSFPMTIILLAAVVVAVALALVTTMLRRRRPAPSTST